MISCIYSLKCPLDNQIKYIGLTSNFKKRKNQHRCYSQKMSRNNRYNKWKENLKLKNERPIVEIVEIVDRFYLSEREIFWINEFKKKFDLFNLTNGGENVTISDNHNSKFLKGRKLEDYYGEDRANEIKSKVGLKGESNPNFGGKSCTIEWRKKQSVSQSKKPLLLFENEIFIGEFPNSKSISEYLKCSSSTIRESKRCGWLVKGKYRIEDK
jgi:group I intron endonuclease